LSANSRRKYAWIAALYFAEGTPYGLIHEALPVAFRQAGVDLSSIGLLSLIGLPWTLKFLWAPAVDHLGKRRQWIGAAQLLFAALLVWLSFAKLGSLSTGLWAALALMAVCSATQDIAIDAYTIELLDEEEMGTANGVRVTAYRVALILAGGLFVGLSATLGWPGVWKLAAGVFLALAISSLFVPHAPKEPTAAGTRIWEPLTRLLARPGAWGALLFVLLFKAGDYSLQPMTKPFIVDRGFSAGEIGLMVGTVGVGATMLGAMIGGALTSKWGIMRSLLALGLFQAASGLAFAAAAALPGRIPIWGAVIFEAFGNGLGTAAFLAFLMDGSEKAHAATQYALLSALFGLARSLSGAVSGFLAARLGYAAYFATTFVVALPAFALLPTAGRWLAAKPAAAA
jgi:MFS transporter, PAT family, beta-lactamase induction signal transducer AmpG